MFCLKLYLELLTILGFYATNSEIPCREALTQYTCTASIVSATPPFHPDIQASLSLHYNLAVAQHLHIEIHGIFIINYFPFPLLYITIRALYCYFSNSLCTKVILLMGNHVSEQ